MLGEPVTQGGDVGPQPGPVRERERVDARVHLPAPVGQVVVLPAGVGVELGGRAGQDGAVDPELAQHVQRPRRRRPRLPLARIVEVESGGEVGAARPLAVIALQRQQPGPEPLRHDTPSGRLPLLLGGVGEVALSLPGQGRVGTVEEPVDEFRIHRIQAAEPTRRAPPPEACRGTGPIASMDGRILS